MKSLAKGKGFWGSLALLTLLFWAGPLWAQGLRYPVKEPIPMPEGIKINPIAARLHNEGVTAIHEVSLWLGWRHEELEQATVIARRAVPGTERYGMAQEYLGHAISEDALARFFIKRALEETVGKLIQVNEIEPTFVLAHYNCAVAFIALNRPGDGKNAIHHLEMGLKLDPQNVILRTFYREILGEGIVPLS